MDLSGRAFDNEQRVKRSRAGAPMTYTIHNKGLSTVIDGRDIIRFISRQLGIEIAL